MAEEAIQKKVRSAAYPSIDLEEAIAAVAKLRNSYGRAPFTREDAAKALGYSGVNGASASKVAALAHFGLLFRRGDNYEISELANRIVIPSSEEEKTVAIRQAAMTPKLYSALVSQFDGDNVPGHLTNLLIRHHNIGDNAAALAARNFTKTLLFSGILVDNRICLQDTGDAEEVSAEVPISDVNGFFAKPVVSNMASTGNNNEQSIRLKCGIEIIFPEEFKYDLAMGKFANAIVSLELAAGNMEDSRNGDNANTSN